MKKYNNIQSVFLALVLILFSFKPSYAFTPATTAGWRHSLALKGDGTVWAWGDNSYGKLGDNTSTDRHTRVQVLGPDGIDFLTDITAVAAGGNHSLALKKDGTVWAWGANNDGQLGINTYNAPKTPAQVMGSGGTGFLTDITTIAAGVNHSLALKSNGTVWAWGYNTHGELGDNTTTDRLTPVQVRAPGAIGFLTDVTAIAAGKYHSLALKSDGTVWAWGYNIYGRLGDNTTTDRHTPVQALGLDGTGILADAAAIAAGGRHSLARKSDGTVWAWGFNGNGELGDNTFKTYSSTPVQVTTSGYTWFLTDVTAIAAGGVHSLAIKKDGSVWSWGDNERGQLGDNTTTDPYTSVQVLDLNLRVDKNISAVLLLLLNDSP